MNILKACCCRIWTWKQRHKGS